MNHSLLKNSIELIRLFNNISTLGELNKQPSNINEESFNLNYRLMNEELNEYLDACRAGDLKEIADAAGDMMVVLIGIIFKHGLQDKFIENILSPICISNATKLCLTREEAVDSVAKYKEKGLDTKAIEFNGVYGIFRIVDLKLLKGIKYMEPEIIVK